MHRLRLSAIGRAAAVTCLALGAWGAHAQVPAPAAAASAPSAAASVPDGVTLAPVRISASADASAQGLSPNYAGGQVARGGRAGILGTRNNLDTPFSITAYTNELIQDRQARSVADVLQNDPTVRVARGFGNFQEAYFIRGFILSSDDIAYNGLYSLLPRQYIATELFERVEVLRGASAFLMGASPNGGGVGGNINLLPKRAPNEPLNRVTVGYGEGAQRNLSVDLARRFGPDDATGVRFNAAVRDGGTSVHDEHNALGLAAVGLDWHSRDVRLSGDLGWQDNKLKRTRSSVTLGFGLTALPTLPEPDSNTAQPWSYSNERDLFGTVRGEVDLANDVTAWGAWGFRHNDEANSLAGLTVTDAGTGDANTTRFDNTRREHIGTGEIGVRGTLRTGSIGHAWVLSAAYFEADNKAAYLWDFFNTQATNLYDPTFAPLPAFRDRYDFATNPTGAFGGNDLADPARIGRARLGSVAFGDTLSMADDRVLLTLGARAQTLRVDSFAYDTHVAGTPYDESRTSPVVGAVFKASKQLSVYANYIEGLTKGDTKTDTAGTSNLPPYVSRQKEAGVKYDAGRIGFGAAVFATDKPRTLKFGAPVPVGEDRGVELTTYGEAMPGLRVLGGATWLDTRQQHTGDATVEGKRTLGIPKLQANAGIEWDVAGVDGLAVDGRVLYTGGVYADSANTLPVPNWTRLDIGARYLVDVQGKPLTLRARIDNVADKKYWASAGGYPDQGYLVIGAPRTVTVSASVDF